MTIMHHVEITVTGDCGHVLGKFTDEIEDKYPFYCEECDDDKRSGRYPWKLTTRIIADGTCPAVSPDGDPCTVTEAHQWHYGPDKGAGVRRMWQDGDEASDRLDDIEDRLEALEYWRTDEMRALVGVIASLVGVPGVVEHIHEANAAAEAQSATNQPSPS